MNSWLALGLGFLSCGALVPATHAQSHSKETPVPLEIQSQPVNPRALEPVSVRFTGDYCDREVKVSMQQGQLIVDLFPEPCAIIAIYPPPPRPVFDVQLGRLPAGAWPVTVYRNPAEPGEPRRALGSTTLTVAASSHEVDRRNSGRWSWQADLDFAGLWTNANYAGQGMTVARVGDQQYFFTLYLHGTDQMPRWYSVQDCRLVNFHCAAKVFETTADGVRPAMTRPVGTAVVDFASNSAQIRLNLEGGPSRLLDFTRVGY